MPKSIQLKSLDYVIVSHGEKVKMAALPLLSLTTTSDNHPQALYLLSLAFALSLAFSLASYPTSDNHPATLIFHLSLFSLATGPLIHVYSGKSV